MSTSAPRIKFVLLGTFDARLDGRPVSGAFYNKMRALLAYLAVEREKEHGREALASLLWQDTDPATARGNLRRTLADLRRILELPSGKTLFITTKSTIGFNPEADVDLIEFVETKSQEDERVLDLYRGEFMAGLSLPDCTDFEEWLQMQRESLNRRAVSLLERSASHHEASGDLDKALQFSMRHVELDPWDEEAHARIMRLHALKGEKSAAFRHYLSYCRLMERELGLPPGKTVSALAKHIRSGELSPSIPNLPNRSTAERRRVTVLHCELLSSEDLEEANTLLQGAQSNAIDILREYSAHVVQSHGGTLLAYFGYPEAHEHAALNAVEAACSITSQNHAGIEIHAGIHTGFIVTNSDSRVPDVIGKTSGIAIQLRRLAGSGETIISTDTHHLVKGYFLCDNLGEMPLHGTARSLEAFRVIEKSGARNRLEATGQLTPLVGRSAEIGLLHEHWEKSRQGEGYIFLLRGEAGIGKTRLIRTFLDGIDKDGIVIRELRCHAESAHSPFHPLISMLETLNGFEPGDSAEIRFEKLSRNFGKFYQNADANVLLLLAQLLSIPVDGPVGLSPQQIREKLTLAMIDLLQLLSSRQPVLYIIEDLHWIDPSTLELIARFAQKRRRGSVLMLLTSRSEFQTPWKDDNILKMELSPLSDREVADLVRLIDNEIQAERVGQIVKRADGIPLYAEEMARMASASREDIPPTLHDLLAVKLDALGEAKLVAQLAATIGREFDIELLHALVPSPFELESHLQVLIDAGLITKNPTCQFKHALIADAAYQSQTRTDRQVAHLKIARALQDTELAKNQPEILAQHLGSAGETKSAIECWLAAGGLASMRSANQEAVAHYKLGLALISALQPDLRRNQLEGALQAGLGIVLHALQGYGSPQAAEAFARAIELCGDAVSGEIFQATWGLWVSRMSHYPSALELAQRLPLLAQQLGDPALPVQAHFILGNNMFFLGEFTRSRIHLESAIEHYRHEHQKALLEKFGENGAITGRTFLSFTLWTMGYPERAAKACTEAIAMARQTGHPHSLAYALAGAATFHRWMRQPDEIIRIADEVIELSARHDLALWMAIGQMAKGWADAIQGRMEGLERLKESVTAVRVAMPALSVIFLSTLADLYVRLGQYEKGLVVVHETMDTMEMCGDYHYKAEIFRLKGECHLGIFSAEKAMALDCFNQALEISRKQAARTHELRAAMSIARHYGDTEPLSEIHAWFFEGFDAPDYTEATMLLSR